MPRRNVRVKRTKAKAKNVVQKVIVNVGGRGAGPRKSTAPSQPPRPSPLQQALQLAQMMRPAIPEPLISSVQVLSRLLDPIRAKLEMVTQGVKETQTEYPRLQTTETQTQVLDLPDAPLVLPPSPLISGGPKRMDDVHEEVPLESIDPALAQGKYEASTSINYDALLQQIEQAEGVKGNERPGPNQYTKQALLGLVREQTGRNYPGSTTVPFYKLKYGVMTFIKQLRDKR